MATSTTSKANIMFLTV